MNELSDLLLGLGEGPPLEMVDPGFFLRPGGVRPGSQKNGGQKIRGHRGRGGDPPPREGSPTLKGSPGGSARTRGW